MGRVPLGDPILEEIAGIEAALRRLAGARTHARFSVMLRAPDGQPMRMSYESIGNGWYRYTLAPEDPDVGGQERRST